MRERLIWRRLRREVYMPQKMTIRKERFVLHTSFTILLKAASSRHSILHLRRAPSSRGCSAGMKKRIPLAKLCQGDFSTSLEMIIREERLSYMHRFTILLKGASSRHSILRLRHAPSSRGCSAGIKKRIPLEAKLCLEDFSTSLKMTIRRDARLTFLFIPLCRRLPLRGSLSSAFGAPLLQGAAQLAG